VLMEGDHWVALYKPPYWQVNVDAKEAAKAAERSADIAPFDDEDDEGDAEDAAPAQLSAPRPGGPQSMRTWIRQQLASQYPVCTDAIEAYGLLHRLDVQTSGVLLAAKTYVGAYWLRLQWCSYLVDKEYVCLVHGWVPRDVREIHTRIRVDKKKAPNSRRTISTLCTVGANGKPSFTEVATLAHLVRPALGQSERYSLVVLKLHTGRTHQIRVHMQSIGHPLVTDKKYGEATHFQDSMWCPRNFLHTYHLGFDEVPPASGAAEEAPEPVDILCPLPTDLRGVLAGLRPVDERSRPFFEDWCTGEAARLRAFEEYAGEPRAEPGAEQCG